MIPWIICFKNQWGRGAIDFYDIWNRGGAPLNNDSFSKNKGHYEVVAEVSTFENNISFHCQFRLESNIYYALSRNLW